MSKPVPPLLDTLAFFDCNLSQRSKAVGGVLVVEGKAADTAGSVALQVFADFTEMPVMVESGSEHHTGKRFEPRAKSEEGQV